MLQIDSYSSLLIISNNVISNNNNNGKTIYSYIDCLPADLVHQLYFNEELPSILEYDYFRITDCDIINGLLIPEKRGHDIKKDCVRKYSSAILDKWKRNRNRHVVKNNLTRLLRDMLWLGKWKSRKLIDWLDKAQPRVVFFVAGDALFAYAICRYVIQRYSARLSVYITDDYIMPRNKEMLVGKMRRIIIKKSMSDVVKSADSFFTISNSMRMEYKRIFGKDSKLIVNMTESLQRKDMWIMNDVIRIIYAGSLYYGRENVIEKVANAVRKYNSSSAEKRAEIYVYTNTEPSMECINGFNATGCCKYGGSLSKSELIIELNKADILLFVESFEKEQIEKTRFSLSTKIPEYLSVGKPIIAVGPSNIGSMEYLNNICFCINDMTKLDGMIMEFLENDNKRKHYAMTALKKYKECHNKSKNQDFFIKELFAIN